MYRNFQKDIKKYYLNPALHGLHKEGLQKSDFGLDNTSDLVDGGFGLYSSIDLKKNFGPVKTEYYRIGLVRKGGITFDIGLETFYPVRNHVVLGFPGQIFSLYDKSDDFFCFYMLFTDEFMKGTLLTGSNNRQFPFLSYSGVQCFAMNDQEADEAEQLILKINDEIKGRKPGMSQSIRLYIQLILILAGRSYGQEILTRQESTDGSAALFKQYIKLVSRHFLEYRKVADYAKLLHISPDHLNRVIRSQSGKTAHELIDDMIMKEAKAYLLHSSLSIAEIAYKLEYADPSYFNKSFKKLAGCTPSQYRSQSE